MFVGEDEDYADLLLQVLNKGNSDSYERRPSTKWQQAHSRLFLLKWKADAL